MADHTEHARRWISALTRDTDEALELYSEELLFDDSRDEDHVFDTATDKHQLRERIAHFANENPDNGDGIHHFEILDVLSAVGDQGTEAVTILWQWTGEHLAGYRGVPAHGQTLSARGQTWHQLDAGGKIVRESTYWNDVPVYQRLGLPVLTPHYWAADFDPSSLVS